MCPACGNRFPTDEEEAIHNTGECRCEKSKQLCWRPWLGTCQFTPTCDVASDS